MDSRGLVFLFFVYFFGTDAQNSTNCPLTVAPSGVGTTGTINDTETLGLVDSTYTTFGDISVPDEFTKLLGCFDPDPTDNTTATTNHFADSTTAPGISPFVFEQGENMATKNVVAAATTAPPPIPVPTPSLTSTPPPTLYLTPPPTLYLPLKANCPLPCAPPYYAPPPVHPPPPPLYDATPPSNYVPPAPHPSYYAPHPSYYAVGGLALEVMQFPFLLLLSLLRRALLFQSQVRVTYQAYPWHQLQLQSTVWPLLVLPQVDLPQLRADLPHPYQSLRPLAPLQPPLDLRKLFP